jgi:hypothetical protein
LKSTFELPQFCACLKVSARQTQHNDNTTPCRSVAHVLEDNWEEQLTDNISNSQILKMSNAELAVSYAALILADDGVDITV